MPRLSKKPAKPATKKTKMPWIQYAAQYVRKSSPPNLARATTAK